MKKVLFCFLFFGLAAGCQGENKVTPNQPKADKPAPQAQPEAAPAPKAQPQEEAPDATSMDDELYRAQTRIANQVKTIAGLKKDLKSSMLEASRQKLALSEAEKKLEALENRDALVAKQLELCRKKQKETDDKARELKEQVALLNRTVNIQIEELKKLKETEENLAKQFDEALTQGDLPRAGGYVDALEARFPNSSTHKRAVKRFQNAVKLHVRTQVTAIEKTLDPTKRETYIKALADLNELKTLLPTDRKVIALEAQVRKTLSELK